MPTGIVTSLGQQDFNSEGVFIMKINKTLTLGILVFLLSQTAIANPGNNFFHLLRKGSQCAATTASISPVGNWDFNEDNLVVNFTVQLTTPACVNLPIEYNVQGNAVSGVNYTSLAKGTLTIPQGASSGVISYSLTQNAVQEVEKSVSLALLCRRRALTFSRGR